MASTSPDYRNKRNSRQSLPPQSPTPSTSQSEQDQPDVRALYDALSKDQLQGISRYNESIIHKMLSDGVEVSKSAYLQQVIAEQQEIEARLAMFEQRPDETEEFRKTLPPLPEYVLSVKNRAAQRPMVLRGRPQAMSLEEAAMIERQHAESTRRKAQRQRPQNLSSLSEREKHAAIMEYMNYRGSDEDEDEDEDDEEFWAEDGEVADETGAVGGEWVDTNDISRLISVDRDRAMGGFYTNFVEDP
ncbi:hypothetical protein FRB91_001808 [Serendipita sp. 411]|nr:hypothetical protein FRC19_003452 [Serendipita sp. 401]KAG8830683.1 hypothetical protein FRC18_007735 [Serendipita sp. 400]KAG8855748.1 hypothetical protein FRB91_001808 [Serendipita sp. 411]KAG9057367.1 hypothetical protein FS842_007068 [Serendipita sp. 407]